MVIIRSESESSLRFLRHTGFSRLWRFFVACTIILVQVGMPAAHALHVRMEEAEEQSQERIELASLLVPKHTADQRQRHEHHHHDESQCSLCQAYLALRHQNLTIQAAPDLRLDRWEFAPCAILASIWSSPSLSAPIARGPPDLV